LVPPIAVWVVIGPVGRQIRATEVLLLAVLLPPAALATVGGTLVGLGLHPRLNDAWRLGRITALLSAVIAAVAWSLAVTAYLVSDSCGGAIPDPHCHDPNSWYPLPESVQVVLPFTFVLGAVGGALGAMVVAGLALGGRLARRSKPT